MRSSVNKRTAAVSASALLAMLAFAGVWAAAQVIPSPEQRNLPRGYLPPPSLPSQVNFGWKPAVRPEAAVPFPSATSQVIGSIGFIDDDEVGYFWSKNRGDSVTETLSGPNSIGGYALDVDVIANIIASGQSVSWKVTINNVQVDTFTVPPDFFGTISRTATFSPILGPNYTVKMSVTNEVPHDGGSHSFRYAGNGFHQIEFIAAPPCPATVALANVPDGRFVLDTLYRFRDEVMLQNTFKKRYVDMFYTHAFEASWILLNNSDLRFRIAQLLWRQQSTFGTLIQNQTATVKAEDVREVDALIGLFMEKASLAFATELRTLRQGVRDRSLLTLFGVRVTD
jgi:hypothetical protein